MQETVGRAKLENGVFILGSGTGKVKLNRAEQSRAN